MCVCKFVSLCMCVCPVIELLAKFQSEMKDLCDLYQRKKKRRKEIMLKINIVFKINAIS